MALKKSIVVQVFLDILCYILSLSVGGVLHVAGTPAKRGFFCDDQSLKYKLQEDIVSSSVLSAGLVGIPLVVISIVEVLLFRRLRNQKQYRAGAVGCGVHPLVYYMYRFYGTLHLMLVMNHSLTMVTKLSLGRLRPHFMDLCKPDMEHVHCNTSYVTDYQCTSTDEAAIRDARSSFVSGHASHSMAAAIYTILYLQARFVWQQSLALRPLMQSALAGLGLFVGFSRVSDHNHHWSDVLGGNVLGTCVALLMGLSVAGFWGESRLHSRLHHESPESHKSVHSEALEPRQPDHRKGLKPRQPDHSQALEVPKHEHSDNRSGDSSGSTV